MRNRVLSLLVVFLVVGLIGLGLVDRLIVEDVTVTYDDLVIDVFEMEDSDQPFVLPFKSLSNPVKIGLEDSLKINIKNKMPDSLSISDYILDNEGQIIHESLTDESTELITINDTYYITIKAPGVDKKTQASEDEVYRGIEIVMTDKEGVVSFLFVIRTPVGE